MKRVWVILILAAFIFSFGCVSGGGPGVADDGIAVEAIYQSTTCLPSQIESKAVWIGSHFEFQRLWDNLHRHRLKGSGPTMPEVDFSDRGILVIHMGRQPTGGYAIELADPMGRVKNGIASVSIDWISPETGTMVVQMITAPCILLKLETGAFRSLQAIDKQGRVKAIVDLPMRRE